MFIWGFKIVKKFNSKYVSNNKQQSHFNCIPMGWSMKKDTKDNMYLMRPFYNELKDFNNSYIDGVNFVFNFKHCCDLKGGWQLSNMGGE